MKGVAIEHVLYPLDAVIICRGSLPAITGVRDPEATIPKVKAALRALKFIEEVDVVQTDDSTIGISYTVTGKLFGKLTPSVRKSLHRVPDGAHLDENTLNQMSALVEKAARDVLRDPRALGRGAKIQFEHPD